MAHERWTNKAMKTLMVAVFAISSVWFGQVDGRASDETPCDWQTREGCCDPETGQECSPCPTGLAILGARQTDHLWLPSAGSGTPPQGRAVIEFEIGWPGEISLLQNAPWGLEERTQYFETAGVHEVVVAYPPPDAKEIYDSQQPKAHDYELTFQPNPQEGAEHCAAADGTFIWPSDQTYTETTSITWTPLPYGCLHTSPFEIPCYGRTVTLAIAKNVFSGKIAEPAGGTRCSKDLNQEVVVEIQKAIDCAKCFKTVAKVRASGETFSKKFDLSKAKFKVLRRGTFAAHVWVTDATSYSCGYANSSPVKKT